MMRKSLTRNALLACWVATLFAGQSHAQFGDSAFERPSAQKTGSDLVSMSIDASDPVLQPGRAMAIALVFEIEPEWYLYWQNPGETGLPPDVEWELPAGVSVSDAQWPAPDRKVLPGGIVDYVYFDRLVLFYELTVDPEQFTGDTLAIEATASWLVCKEVCLLGDGEAEATIPVGAWQPGMTSPSSGDRYPVAVSRIPEPAVDAVRVAWEGRRLVIRAPGADRLTWMPGPNEDATPTNILEQGVADGDTIRIDYEIGEDAEDVWGVLAVESKDSTRWYELHPGLPGQR